MSQLYLEQLASVLSRHRDKGLIGFKSEFESEGIRPSELNTLNILAKSNGLKTALKIGGAEAKTDLIAAFNSLTDYVIAPMIETPYAAKKCISMYQSLLPTSQSKPPSLLINIETNTALQNLDSILDEITQFVSGIVFGRVDFTLSSNLERSMIHSDYVSEAALHVSSRCSERDLEFVLGGGVSVDSIPFLKQLHDIRLDRFETRKCIIAADSLFTDSIHELLQDCVLAELLWLKAKSSIYSSISVEDRHRIEMLEKRHLYNISSCV